MAILRLEPLPPRTTKGELLDLLAGPGGLDRRRVGKIDLHGATAAIEVPDDRLAALVRALDGVALRDRKLRASARTAADPAGHFGRLARLLDQEARAEADQAARQADDGESRLSGLVVRSEDAGLGGVVVLTLGPRQPDRPLPWTRLGGGTPVLLRTDDTAPPTVVRGVVCDRTDRVIRVAVTEPDDGLPDAAAWSIGPSDDHISRRRMLDALERAASAGRDRLAELREVLLGEREPAFTEPPELTPPDAGLNESQREAVAHALAAADVAVIHGPPGTGKTTAVAELVRQAVRRGESVLACAPSNLAVDNLLERLLAAGEPVLRLGHPARVLPALAARTLDALADDHPDARNARKLTKQARALFRQAGRYTRAKPEPGARQAMRQEARSLLADARRLEAQAVEQVLNRAPIVGATLTGLDSETLGRRVFDLAVIDEAGQAVEPAGWVPLLRAKRVVLAGDHFQLPPTVLSPAAAAGGLAVSLLERVMALCGQAVSRRLRVQYRMHETIAGFSAEEFYEADLLAADAVRGHRLCDLPGVQATPLTETPLRFLDTAGAGYDEEPEPDGPSRRNPQEAALAARQVRALVAAGVPAASVGVITPYAAQARLLRELLDDPAVEVDSVDGFQGREKEAIVLSLVRSNAEGEVGFLADERRMNVALTRARRLLVVVGDSATLGGQPFYARWLAYVERVGAYGSVWEEG
jgi:ATP-dependent RNA/DNA helicase IGHMBP2